MCKQHVWSTGTTWESVAPAKSFWKDTVMHPQAHPDYVKVVIENRKNVDSVYVLYASVNGVVTEACLGRIEKTSLPVTFGYATLLNIPVRQLTIVDGGILGINSPEKARDIVHELIGIAGKKIDTIRLENIVLGSCVHQALAKVSPLRRQWTFSHNKHWYVHLPPTWKEFFNLTKSKHRTLYRKCERKIGELSGGNVTVKRYTDLQDLDEFCIHAEHIASTTYHRGIGVGFHDTPEMRSRLSLEMQNNWLRAYILFANNKPTAFWMGKEFKGIFFLDYTGYSAEYRQYAPGTILFLKMIENLYTLGGITKIDFGSGDAEYKRRFGEGFDVESDVLLYAITPPLILVNMLHSLLFIMHTGAERMLVATGLLQKIKKIWRNKSTITPSSEE